MNFLDLLGLKVFYEKLKDTFISKDKIDTTSLTFKDGKLGLDREYRFMRLAGGVGAKDELPTTADKSDITKSNIAVGDVYVEGTSEAERWYMVIGLIPNADDPNSDDETYQIDWGLINKPIGIADVEVGELGSIRQPSSYPDIDGTEKKRVTIYQDPDEYNGIVGLVDVFGNTKNESDTDTDEYTYGVIRSTVADKNKYLKGDGTWAEISSDNSDGRIYYVEGNELDLYTTELTGSMPSGVDHLYNGFTMIFKADVQSTYWSGSGSKDGNVTLSLDGQNYYDIIGISTGDLDDRINSDYKVLLLFLTFIDNKWYNNTIHTFTGATNTKMGESGLVPQAGITNKDMFLKGDGTWSDVTTITKKITVLQPEDNPVDTTTTLTYSVDIYGNPNTLINIYTYSTESSEPSDTTSYASLSLNVSSYAKVTSEYCFNIITGTKDLTVTLPSAWKFPGDTEPSFEANKIYNCILYMNSLSDAVAEPILYVSPGISRS